MISKVSKLTEISVAYVSDDEHYTQVFRRMTEVKRSLKIATANLKNFNVTVETDGGEETLKLCDFFLRLIERGVQVQVVYMKPFGFFLYAKENCPQLLESPLFELENMDVLIAGLKGILIMVLHLIAAICIVYAAIAVAHLFEGHRRILVALFLVVFATINSYLMSFNMRFFWYVQPIISAAIFATLTWYILDRKLNLE